MLVVDLPTVRRNTTQLVEELTARGVAVRPHAKTHKSIRIARLLSDLGCAGLTTATTSEAEVFAASGLGDVFIAYPVCIRVFSSSRTWNRRSLMASSFFTTSRS